MKKSSQVVMPDPARHPVLSWIPAFAGMTNLRYIAAGVILVLSLLVIPAAAMPAQPVSVEILYMNHGPLLSTIKGIRELCNSYGKDILN